MDTRPTTRSPADADASALGRLWERLLSAMQERIGHQDVEIWLRKPVKPLSLEGSRLLLRTENGYYADWIRENYLVALTAALAAAIGGQPEIGFTWDGAPTGDERPDPARSPAARGFGLNPLQTFENFVVGKCNEFSHAGASAVADRPARAYNPLYIYGLSGMGKTHLMHAIGNAALQRHPDAKVVYVTAEAFMNEMIQCVKVNRMEDFRARYRQRATILLVDDVHVLGGRERTQEEFFHTFNALQASGRQVVLTSDKPPAEIDKLEPRLRTRFSQGLLADVGPPDKETLLAILANKAQAHRLDLPGDVSDQIATSVAGRSVRDLEGVVYKLSALHELHRREPITLAFLRQHMSTMFQQPASQVTVAAIIEAVARFHSLRSSDILGNRRTRTLSEPRHLAMFLARKHTNLSFPELGREFDRDQSTIQHGVKKVAEEAESNPDLAYKLRLIEQGLRPA